jgi:hypothetical protein
MRFLMKIVMPTVAENKIMGDPQLDERLRRLYTSVGGREAYSRDEDGRRVDYILVEISDLAQITPHAKQIFEVLGVKTEFIQHKMVDKLFGI